MSRPCLLPARAAERVGALLRRWQQSPCDPPGRGGQPGSRVPPARHARFGSPPPLARTDSPRRVISPAPVLPPRKFPALPLLTARCGRGCASCWYAQRRTRRAAAPVQLPPLATMPLSVAAASRKTACASSLLLRRDKGSLPRGSALVALLGHLTPHPRNGSWYSAPDSLPKWSVTEWLPQSRIAASLRGPAYTLPHSHQAPVSTCA